MYIKTLVTLLYLLYIIYSFLSFTVYSCRFSVMPWYEPDTMGIQFGFAAIIVISPILFIIYLVLLLFRTIFKSNFIILLITNILITIPAVLFNFCSLKLFFVEYSGIFTSLISFIVLTIYYFKHLAKLNKQMENVILGDVV